MIKFKPGSFYIEAQKFIGTRLCGEDIEKWGQGQIKFVEGVKQGMESWLEVQTPRGLMFCGPGDFVMKDKHNNFMTCRALTFEVLYARQVEEGAK